MRWVFYGLLIINVAFFAWQKRPADNAVDPAMGAVVTSADDVVTLRLLSELGEQAGAELERRVDTKKCDVYGPFFSASESQLFLRWVVDAGIKGTQFKERVVLKPYYRLYVQLQGSIEKTQALLNRLRGYQLNAQIVTEGRLRNAVSLGDFETQQQVKRLQQKLSVHGLRIEVLEKSRDYWQYWVYLSPGSAALLTGALQSQLIEEYPEIFHQQKSCKPVASGE